VTNLALFITTALAETAEGSGFTLSEMWEHAGFIAKSVIVCLVLMLLWALFVGVERLIAFSAARKQSMAVVADILKPLEGGDVDAALKVTKNEEYKAAYIGALLGAGLQELSGRFDAHGISNAHRMMDKAEHEEVAKLKKGMTILATVGSTAPFVGLFGTTFGVINAFQGMASAGSGLASISAGISEALITTGVGIGVAVLGVWLFNYFNFRIEKVNEELDSARADFFDWADKQLQGTSEAAK